MKITQFSFGILLILCACKPRGGVTSEAFAAGKLNAGETIELPEIENNLPNLALASELRLGNIGVGISYGAKNSGLAVKVDYSPLQAWQLGDQIFVELTLNGMTKKIPIDIVHLRGNALFIADSKDTCGGDFRCVVDADLFANVKTLRGADGLFAVESWKISERFFNDQGKQILFYGGGATGNTFKFDLPAGKESDN